MSSLEPGSLTPTPTPTAPVSSLTNQLNAVLKGAPELGVSPGLSVGLAQAGGNINQNAQATARGTNAISDANAHNQVAQSVGGSNELTNALNWFGNHVVADVGQVGSDVVSGLKQAGVTAMKVLNAPLSVAQHEYRYLHDVEARHGLAAAALEGIGIAAGAVGGAIIGAGVPGAVMGAEAATAAEGQVFYKDSWNRTTNGATYVDPNTNQPVSLGRDVVAELSKAIPEFDRGTTLFKVTSGLLDGIANIGMDPLVQAGNLIGDAKSAEGLSGTLGQYFGGTGVMTAEDVQRAYDQYGSVRRAFQDIANKSAGEIAATPAYLPIAQQEDLRNMLGEAQTPEEVAQVFQDVIRTGEMAFSSQLPSLAITRLPFQYLRESMGNSSIPGVQKLWRATNRLPTAFDDVAKEFTNKSFDPTAIDDGTVGIYRMAAFTENRRTAAMIANEYANAPDLATKIRIYRNLSLSTLFNMAGFRGYSLDEYLAENFNNPDDRRAMAQAIDDAIGGGMFGRGAVYGLDDEGRNLSLVRDPQSGWEYGAAITKNQTGRLAFLDLAQAREAAKALAGARDYYGRINDFAYNHITQGIFKPIVLLTPSYALHISLAEMIPNALRLGVRNMVKSAMEINATRLGEKANEGELNAIQGVVWRLVNGSTEEIPLAARYVEYNDGQLVPRGLSAGHDFANEVVNREEQTVSLLRRHYYDTPTRTTKNFGVYGVGHEQYVNAWQSWLHEIGNDDASQLAASKLLEGARSGLKLDEASGNAAREVADYLRNLPESERGRFVRALEPMTGFKDIARPAGMDQYDEWARTIVANVRGATRGADRTMNVPLLDHIRNGETPTQDELSAIPETQRPINVKGREIVPDGNSKIQRLANVGFQKVLNPMVNFLSRQPIAFAEFKNQWRMVEPMIESGVLSEDEAMTLAMDRTVQNAIRNIHNLTDRSQWTVTMRNWAPFYFAQEQAYRRMGRLLASDPGAFRKYQLMISNIHDVGQVFQNKNGQGYFVMPGTGWMTAGVVSALATLGIPVEGSSPVGMGWNLSSSSVIFPLSAGARPDIGPLVAVPTEAIAQLFPETLSPTLKADLTATTNTLLGPAASESLYAQMIPNIIVQRLISATFPSFNPRSFNSTMMQVLATLEYEKQVPPPTANHWQMQGFIDKVRMQTQILYAVKAIVGAVTPVSPELTDQLYNKNNAELSADIKKEGSLSKGIQVYLSKNPDANAFTVFQSSNQDGVSVPASVQAEKWIIDNMNVIRLHPSMLLLMPPNTNTTYNAQVYNEQIAQGMRVKWFPGDITPNGDLEGYLAQLYVNAGNAIVLDKWYPQYEKAIQGLSGTAKYDAEQNWQQTLTNYAKQNPIWGRWWNSNDREIQRSQAIQDMKNLLNSPEAPKTQLADDTRKLLVAYDAYQNQLAVGTQDGFAGQSQSSINQQWKDNLYATVAAHPELTNVVTGLFMSIPLTSSATVTNSGSMPGVFTAKTWNKAA